MNTFDEYAATGCSPSDLIAFLIFKGIGPEELRAWIESQTPPEAT